MTETSWTTVDRGTTASGEPVTMTIADDGVLRFPKDIPPGTPCANCGKPRASLWWAGEGGTFAAVHGQAVPWCTLCAAREQLKHARERAAVIPELEALIVRLKDEEKP